MQAVQIQTVEAGLAFAVLSTLPVVRVQPVDEIPDNDIAPHPRRKALKAAQRLVG